MTLRSVLGAWNRFLFEPRSPVPVAVYRIFFGLLILANSFLLWPELSVWFGETGVLSARSAHQLAGGARISLFDLLPAGEDWLLGFFILFNVSALALTLGLFTRLSALLVFLGLVSLHHRNMLVLNSGDTFLRLSSFYLVFSQAGSVLSLDRLRRVLSGKDAGGAVLREPWAQRLIQIQIAVLYLMTFLWKLQGKTWLDGTAAYYIHRLEEFWRFPASWLTEFMPFIRMGTWSTLLIEFALGVLVWFSDLRYSVLALGVLLHLWIEYSMNIPLFSATMIFSYVVFVEPRDLGRVMDRLRERVAGRFGSPAPLFYDGDCVFCVRTVRAVRMMDLFRRIDDVNFRDFRLSKAPEGFDPGRAEKEILLRRRDGAWLGGFEAFRWMAWRLPLLWGIAPFLYFPGVSPAGRKIYRWVSAHRSVFLGKACGTDRCGS